MCTVNSFLRRLFVLLCNYRMLRQFVIVRRFEKKGPDFRNTNKIEQKYGILEKTGGNLIKAGVRLTK